MKKVVLKLIRLYQKYFSLDHGARGRIQENYRVCRFYPSCSEYSYTAIDRFGIWRGGLLSVWRIIRCNPLTPAGTYDPVPEKHN